MVQTPDPGALLNRNAARERLRRLVRLRYPQTWRSLALIATDPSLDPVFERVRDWRSMRWLSHPEPWLLPAAVEYIRRHLEPGQRVVEWGSGASTLWFAGRGAQVEAVEHDPHWEREIASRLPAPSRVLRGPADAEGYVAKAECLEKADWIVIDGIHRIQCAERVAAMLRQGLGKRPLRIVFDDTHRLHYGEALHELSLLAAESKHFCGSFIELRAQMTSVLIFFGRD